MSHSPDTAPHENKYTTLLRDQYAWPETRYFFFTEDEDSRYFFKTHTRKGNINEKL